MKNIRDNYDDFERLMGAKMNEIKALIAVGSGSGGGAPAAGSDPKVQEWIAFHEPKINYMQKSIQQFENELQEKVSYAMVQSMIAEATGGVAPSGKAYDSYQKSRLSNVKSMRNQPPQIDAEESVGKATEDFGGYSLGEDGSG